VEVFEQAPGEFGFGCVAALQADNQRVGGEQTAEQMLAKFLVQFLRHLLPESSTVPHHARESHPTASPALGPSLISLCG